MHAVILLEILVISLTVFFTSESICQSYAQIKKMVELFLAHSVYHQHVFLQAAIVKAGIQRVCVCAC